MPKEQLIKPDTIKDGWTQSEIGVLEECQYKWYLMYNLRLSGSSVAMYFVEGQIWHSVMESMYKNGGKKWDAPKYKAREKYLEQSPESEALIEEKERLMAAYAEMYAEHFVDDFASLQIDGVEEVVDLTVEWKGQDIRLKAMIDLRGRQFGRKVIWDHKTTSKMSAQLLNGWSFRFQFMFYWWLDEQLRDEKASRFIINAMIKPSIRVKQAESYEGFLFRLKNEIRQTPEKYFYRESLILTKGKMEKFKTDVLAPKLNKIALIQNPETPKDVLSALVLNKNTEACIDSITGAVCPFFEICDKGLDHNKFTRREHKHPELAHA